MCVVVDVGSAVVVVSSVVVDVGSVVHMIIIIANNVRRGYITCILSIVMHQQSNH